MYTCISLIDERKRVKKGDLMTNTVHKAKHTEINDIH